MPEPQSLGARIRSLRRARDLTQEELAERIGVSYVTVSDWERDVWHPEPANFSALARELGVNEAELRYGPARHADHMQPKTGLIRETYAGWQPELPPASRAFIHRFLAELAERRVPEADIDRVRHVMFELASFMYQMGAGATIPPSQFDLLIADDLDQLADFVRAALQTRGIGDWTSHDEPLATDSVPFAERQSAEEPPAEKPAQRKRGAR